MKNSIFLFLYLFTCVFCVAQQKPAAKTANAGLPKLTVMLGGSKSGNISVKQLQNIIDSPLLVKDEKGVIYPLKSFRINYTFKSTYRDEETDKVREVKDFRAYDFYDTNRLSEDWRNSIRDNVKVDDEMLINNVVVKLKNGKSFFAPELKLKVQ
ncbi:MAG: hypothetical protein ACRC2O_17670 [Chitinophagaceae bacterium]